MNKKAQEGVQVIGFNAFTLLLVMIVLVAFFASGIPGKLIGLLVGKKDSGEQKQLDAMIKHINADIENIKNAGQKYPIGLDGTKYALVAKNCNVDNEGKCKSRPKTKLCLRRVDIDAKDYCSKKSLDFSFNSDFYPIVTKNLLIKWENNRLSLYSS